MNKEISAGAVIFKKENNNILFLVIYSKRNGIWGFPKGHLENGETEKQAAYREIKEEVGLGNLNFIDGFREEVIYETISKRLPFKGEKIEKHAIYFLCDAKDDSVAVDGREISGHKYLSLGDAERILKFNNLNLVIRKAYDFLQKI
jgi:bis(5'-nucleosidyl)-tetraphosphatase